MKIGYTTELDTLGPGERRRIRRLFDHHGLDMPAVAGHCSLLERDPELHAETLRRLPQGHRRRRTPRGLGP